MNFARPSLLILIGSFVFSLFSLLSTLAVNVLIIELPLYLIALIPICTGSAAYFIFHYLMKQFIQKRLFLVYRRIQGKEFNNLSLDQMIQTADLDVEEWNKNKAKEILQLKEQEAFRREFLGNLAHELKTPVFSIQGYILTLLDGGIDDPSINRDFLERASKATDRMSSILEDLDKISKLQERRLKMVMQNFDIVELAKEVLAEFEFKANEKNIALKSICSLNQITVFADRQKIAQVMTNLVNNALFYGSENGYCKIYINLIDDLVQVEIKDNGLGIDPKHLPRLFERFYRVEKSRNRNEGGSGIGLAIAKHILESHGQTISVKSEVGKGSSFIFTLDKSKHSSVLSSRGIPIN